MIGRTFKTIVFFGTNFSQFSYIKEAFTIYPVVKIFQTVNPDEIDQILHQSNVTAILINDRFYAGKLAEMNVLDLKEAGVRTYFLDDLGLLTKEEISQMSLQRVTTLQYVSRPELKTKLEMFILGKIQLGKYKDKDGKEVIAPQETVYPRPTYFSHFKRNKDFWETVVSTHEQEREIEILFNRSWTVYCIDLLKRADDIKTMENDPNFSEKYHGIVFPHVTNGTLSVIHIKKDHHDFDNVLQKALEFLSKI